eukprot:g390.t1
MLFPCGWPKSYFAFPSSYGHDEIVSCLSRPSSSQFLWPTSFVVSKRAVQLWASTENPFKLGQKFLPPSELLRIGPQLTAEWNPTLSSAVTLTSKGWIVLYTLTQSSKKLTNRLDANGPISQAYVTKIEVLVTIQLFANSIGNCMVSKGTHLLIGTADGMLQCYDWIGMLQNLKNANYEFRDDDQVPDWYLGSVEICGNHEWSPKSSTPSQVFDSDSVSGSTQSKGAIVDLDFSDWLQKLTVTFEDGSTGFCNTENLTFGEFRINQWINPKPGDSVQYKVTCARIGDQANLVAIGCTNGTVLLYPLNQSNSECLRKLTLKDWGHGGEVTGPIGDICWNGDCSAFAVGFRQRGLVVWTPSGCRLMCSLPQTPLKSNTSIPPLAEADSPLAKLSTSTSPEGSEIPTLEWGVSVLCWTYNGFRLWIGQTSRAREIWEITFVRSFTGRHRISQPTEEVSYDVRELREVYLLYGDDRILLISELPSGGGVVSGSDPEMCSRISSSQLVVRHVLVPQEYITQNWPIKTASISFDGAEIAIAGTHGLAIYNRRSEKWKLFGDVSQEQSLCVKLLTWMEQVVVVTTESISEKSELLLFPSFHLDHGSMLLRHELSFNPIAMDCFDRYILVAASPLELILFECQIDGEISWSNKPNVSLIALRELSLCSLENPLMTISLTRTPGSLTQAPDQCVLLRWGGIMTLLDLGRGVEQVLANEIECFWLSDVARIQETPEPSLTLASSLSVDMMTPSSQRKQIVSLVEMPWWAYGARGMELWFPSSLAEPLSPRAAPSRDQMLIGQLDPELEFDREVYPVGISLADAAIIGVSQRLIRSSSSTSLSASLPCFSLIPDTQPVLPCLLRRLLQRGAVQEARLLAKKHQKLGLHFSKSLEWLLFTALEIEAGASRTPNQSSLDLETDEEHQSSGVSMLTLATALVKEFPQYPDVVVSVARKTDTQLWPLLFDAVGRPTACLLVVIDKMEGGVLAKALSLQVLKAALSNGEYDLVAEVIRYAVSQSDLDLIFTKDQEEEKQSSPSEQSMLSSWWSWMWNAPDVENPSSKDNRPVVLSGVSYEATRNIDEHVRFLLDYGRLKPLAALGKSLSSLGGGGLPALLSYRHAKDSLTDEITKESVFSSLSTVRTEMIGPSFEDDAELLLETCQHAHSLSWSFALALFLHHIPVIVSFKLKHPLLWDQVYYDLLRMQGFERFLDVMKEVQQSSN